MNVVRTCPRSLSILCALYHGGMLGAHARSSFSVPSRSIQYIVAGTISWCYVLLYLAYCRWVNIEELYYLSFDRLLRLTKIKRAKSNAGIPK